MPLVTPLPAPFIERMQTLLGEEASALIAALAQPAVTGLRVNTLKLSVEAFKTLAPWPLEGIPWCPAGFSLPAATAAGKHPYHAAGLYYLQEPSAMSVAEVVAPQPGERVLDLAAAPGGKSTHLSALLGDSGLLVSNEVNTKRARALGENLERWGASRSLILNTEVAKLASAWGASFDRVLLDAPCSGEGMFRKSEDARSMWSEATIRSCALRQSDLLSEAARLVTPGGTLVYSTCTFAPEENEQVIAAFLAAHAEFELEPITLKQLGHGRNDWATGTTTNLSKTARLWPQHHSGEGHFIAQLKKVAGEATHVKPVPLPAAPKAARDLWKSFCQQTGLTLHLTDTQLAVFGDRLYAVPSGLGSFKGLHTLRAGLQLGTLKKGRLEPAHALALSLDKAQASKLNQIQLDASDERLQQYLQGHLLEEAGADGWIIVTVEGYPLGWGKRSQGVIKNFYPKGLRHY